MTKQPNGSLKRARTRLELDREIDALSIGIKRAFLLELANGSIGRANELSGINDMWLAARLVTRLVVQPDLLKSISGEVGND